MFEGKLARLAVKEARLWSNFLNVENSRSSGLNPCLIDKLVIISRAFFCLYLVRGRKGGVMGQTELMRIGVELGGQIFNRDLYTAPSFSRPLVGLRQNITFTNLHKGDHTR